MFAALAVTLLASSVAAIPQAASDITTVTPASLIECQPILLQWSGGQAPYYVSLIPGKNNPSAAAVVDFGQLDGTQQTWQVTQPAGTDLTLKVTDSQGKSQFSAPVTVQKGSSDSCLNASGSAASTGASETGATDAAAGSTDAAATDASSETAATDATAASVTAAAQGAADASANTAATDAANTAATGASTAGVSAASTGGASASGDSKASSTSAGAATGTEKAAASSTPTSGARRLIASTGLVAAVVAAVAFF